MNKLIKKLTFLGIFLPLTVLADLAETEIQQLRDIGFNESDVNDYNALLDLRDKINSSSALSANNTGNYTSAFDELCDGIPDELPSLYEALLYTEILNFARPDRNQEVGMLSAPDGYDPDHSRLDEYFENPLRKRYATGYFQDIINLRDFVYNRQVMSSLEVDFDLDDFKEPFMELPNRSKVLFVFCPAIDLTLGTMGYQDASSYELIEYLSNEIGRLRRAALSNEIERLTQ